MYILSFSRIKEIWWTPFRTFIRRLIKSNVSRIYILNQKTTVKRLILTQIKNQKTSHKINYKTTVKRLITRQKSKDLIKPRHIQTLHKKREIFRPFATKLWTVDSHKDYLKPKIDFPLECAKRQKSKPRLDKLPFSKQMKTLISVELWETTVDY